HEKEIQELKSQVSDLEKRLRIALKDVDKKEGFLLNREQQLTILEEEVIKLKNRIRKITSRKYNKPVMAQTIQAPGPNEYQTTSESVRNAFRNIDAILRRTPAIPRSTIENEFTDIKNAVARLRDIAEWENTQSQVYYQQVGNLTNQLANTNNNFDLINQAYNFQTGQLQNCQADLQDWRRKHAKRKGKHIKQKAKHKKWENKEKGSRQIIINLNQQILALQNNPPNMATPIGDLTGIAPLLANVEFYNGQVQPDEWYNGINAILSYPAVTQIDDAHKNYLFRNNTIPLMGNPPFNPYYLGKLTELCPSIQWNIWKSLTTGKYPITIEQASGIYPEIEKKIDREILNYKNRKQRQRRKPLLENLSYIYNIDMNNKETQTQAQSAISPKINITPICMRDHEEEINRRVKKGLNIFHQQLLKYNVDTFGKFMQGVTRDYEEQVNANKKLRFEIEKMKLQLQEAEDTLFKLSGASFTKNSR
ncbi:5550_t:CDS:2, partial [Entrophospora sp. SA101]